MTNLQPSSVFTAIVGRPNVGKSSLLNAFVGEKIAIVSQKPQTTRTRVTGVVTHGPLQYVFLDTPGIHAPRTKLGERMVKAVGQSVGEVDVAVMVFEPRAGFTEAEEKLMADLRDKKLPAIAAVNKIDTLRNRDELLPRLAEVDALGIFREIFPISVQEGQGLNELLSAIGTFARPGPHFFDDDALSDMPEKVIVAELVREKLLTHLREEVPHGTAVVVESFKERSSGDIVDIDVNIFCEKKSHKGMIIGKGGAMLKTIASEARTDIEGFLGVRVNLQCWVKVKEDWRDSDFLLNTFGFEK